MNNFLESERFIDMMPSSLVVYLAGNIGGYTYEEARKWRIVLASILHKRGIIVKDPLRGKDVLAGKVINDCEENYPNEMVFIQDTRDVRTSDVIIANIQGARAIGTMFELGYAYALNIPSYISACPELCQHPFIDVPSKFMYPGLVPVVEAFLEDYKLEPLSFEEEASLV